MKKEIRIPVILMLIACIGTLTPTTKIDQVLKIPSINLASLIAPSSALAFAPIATSVSLVTSKITKPTKIKAATAVVADKIAAVEKLKQQKEKLLLAKQTVAKKKVSSSTTATPSYLNGWIHQVSRSGNPVSDTQRFVVAAIPAALKTEKKYGVPAAFILAQAILESDRGLSRLAIAGHNYFGVTWQHGTPIYVDGIAYQRFANMGASFDQQGDMLTDPSHGYTSALKFKHNIYRYAQEVQLLGYCSSSDYAGKIKAIADDFVLEAK